MTTVAIIGAGPLGCWLALGAARAGYRVFLEDVMPGNLHHARESIGLELEQNQNSGAQAKSPQGGSAVSCDVLPAVAFVSTIEDAVRDADLAIDCVPDELESKLEILWLLDRMAPPRTVFATPTAKLSIADLASCTYRPEKCIAIAAPPAELQAGAGPALVLRTAPATNKETADLVSGFFVKLGFKPAVERVSV